MKIGVIGGSGFIGRHLIPVLLAQGHQLRASYRSREPAAERNVDWHRMDLNQALEPEHWLEFMSGLDGLIMAAGILRDTRANDLMRVHALAPVAIYSAAAKAGVKRVIHLSALGARADAPSVYHRSKFAGELALAESGLDHVILRPSLIFGMDGDSTRQFLTLARLPRIPVYRSGGQRVQPVHMDDVVELITKLICRTEPSGAVVPVVGGSHVNMRDYYAALRQGMGRGRARFLNAPDFMVRMVAGLGNRLDASPLCTDTLIMLGEHNTADPSEFAKLLNRTPRSWMGFPAEIGQCRELGRNVA